MMTLRKIMAALLPVRARNLVHGLMVRRKMRSMQSHYPEVIERLREKDRVKIAFMVINISVWKLDHLFKLMLEDDKFEPVVVLCPLMSFDDSANQERELKLAEKYVLEKGYPFVRTKLDNGEWLDVKNELQPDIVFFTSPYIYSTLPQYYVSNFTESLNCYVTYSSMNFWDFKWDLNQPFHNYVWRYFAENDKIRGYMQSVGLYKGQNCFVSGFPPFDNCLEGGYTPRKCWKHDQKYKIIWAPHHTIDDCVILQYSNFLDMAEPMMELAERYADVVQFAFKPHPMLRSKLENVWGEERTDKYFDNWDNLSNTQLEAGQYIDLFYTSDAMLFDSSSFITEYIYVDKPSIFINKSGANNMLNDFGQEAMDCHDEAKDITDITRFVENIISGHPDKFADKRKAFREKYILPYNTPSPSANIIRHIKQTISR